MTDDRPTIATEHWEPPCDPRRPYNPGGDYPTSVGGRIVFWVFVVVIVAGALLPVGIAITGLVKTWGGGTWNP